MIIWIRSLALQWFIKTLHKESKYPVKLLAKGKECLLRIEYAVDSNGYVVQPKIISCSNRSFRKAALDTFRKVMNVPTLLKAGKDTLVVQYKLDSSATVNPDTDLLLLIRILMCWLSAIHRVINRY